MKKLHFPSIKSTPSIDPAHLPILVYQVPFYFILPLGDRHQKFKNQCDLITKNQFLLYNCVTSYLSKQKNNHTKIKTNI